MRIVCQQTILMKYHALLVIFEKAAKFEIVVCCELFGGALRVNLTNCGVFMIIYTGAIGEHEILTLNAPIATKVVCFSCLLKCLRSLYVKQCGPSTDCSYRRSLFWVHAVCFNT